MNHCNRQTLLCVAWGSHHHRRCTFTCNHSHNSVTRWFLTWSHCHENWQSRKNNYLLSQWWEVKGHRAILDAVTRSQAKIPGHNFVAGLWTIIQCLWWWLPHVLCTRNQTIKNPPTLELIKQSRLHTVPVTHQTSPDVQSNHVTLTTS